MFGGNGKYLRGLIGAAGLAVMAGVSAPSMSALAAESADGSIIVNVNMARLLRINAPASTVIIGNPGVADVTIQDPRTLVLTGKSYGRTNLIILDANGDPIADTFINVVQTRADLVTVYNGRARATLACTPVCQPTITLGDDTGVTSSSVASSKLISDSAE